MKEMNLKLRVARMKLEKNFQNSEVATTIKNTVDDIEAYSKQLKFDKTLTPSARRLKEKKFTVKAHKAIAQAANRRAGAVLPLLEALDNKVQSKLKTSGSMDVLILLQTAAAIQDMPAKDVYVMARESLDVARAMLLNPVARIKFGVNGDDKKKDTLTSIIEGHVLTDDEQAKAAACREEIGVLADVMASSGALEEQAAQAVAQIESTMAVEPSLQAS